MDGDLYQRIVDAVPDGLIVSRNGRIAFANAAAARLLGATSDEPLVGTSFVAILEACTRDADRQRIAALLAGTSPFTAELQLVRHDGAVLDVEIETMRLDPDAAVLAIVRNTSEKKRAEAAIRENE